MRETLRGNTKSAIDCAFCVSLSQLRSVKTVGHISTYITTAPLLPASWLRTEPGSWCSSPSCHHWRTCRPNRHWTPPAYKSLTRRLSAANRNYPFRCTCRGRYEPRASYKLRIDLRRWQHPVRCPDCRSLVSRSGLKLLRRVQIYTSNRSSPCSGSVESAMRAAPLPASAIAGTEACRRP